MILTLTPETSGCLTVTAWRTLSEFSDRNHAQQRKIISSSTCLWTGSWRYYCTQNIARCPWCDTYRRYRPSNRWPIATGCNTQTASYRTLKVCTFPCKYLASALIAGDTIPVLRALKRLMAVRHYKRSQTVDGVTPRAQEVGLSATQADEMYRY